MYHYLAPVYNNASVWLNGRAASTVVYLATWLWVPFVLWITVLYFDSRQHHRGPSIWRSCALFLHLWPAVLMHLVATKAPNHYDPVLTWFALLLFLRYYRTVVNVYFWFQYKPAVPTEIPTPTPSNCTVIVATVGPDGNDTFAQMVSSILVNRPAHVVFSANNKTSAEQTEKKVTSIKASLEDGTSTYQLENKLSPTPKIDLTTSIKYCSENFSNKRRQIIRALKKVDTPITVFADDTAVWTPRFLFAALPAFSNPTVGFVGTRKWVQRALYPYDPLRSLLANAWSAYRTGFWNTMGALYLVRHNFEIRATNAADGGVFCVSGRTSLIRSCIIQDPGFQRTFVEEYIVRMGVWFKGLGPLNTDDDNFLTRYVMRTGWGVKVQYSEDATVTVPLGQRGKFLKQCARWSRTTLRQNPIALFVDRAVWWRWPVTTWTTYFPWMVNFALVWDPLIVYVFVHTRLYAESLHPRYLIAGLVAFIYATKLVKTVPWFWAHPADFLLYFFPVPAYPLFAYYHSLIKLWTVLTFWDLSWSGRKFPEGEGRKRGKVLEEEGEKEGKAPEMGGEGWHVTGG